MTSVYREDGRLIIAAAEPAATAWQRARGLIGRPAPPPGRALLLAPCRAVHTGFMRFPLDLIFFSRDGRIVRRRDGVPPFRLAWGGRRAWGVLELAAGWLPGPAAQPGDRLVFHDA